MTLLGLTITIILLLFPFVSLRLLALVRSSNARPIGRPPGTPTRLLIVLGSGGHTAEMFSLLYHLDTLRYTHRSYVVSSGDDFSASKATEFERGLFDLARSRASVERKELKQQGGEAHGRTKEEMYGSYDIEMVPRARKIFQSIWTTPFTSMQCLLACFRVLMSTSKTSEVHMGYPDLIVSNGPATAVIIILASLILRFLGLPGTNGKMRTIYVESWARVRRLSLSGKILLRIVDRFLVQWERLAKELNGRAEYIGVLVAH